MFCGLGSGHFTTFLFFPVIVNKYKHINQNQQQQIYRGTNIHYNSLLGRENIY